MPPLFLINGTPASGKTTFSRELMRRFERGLNIPVDDIRDWVVSGYSSPLEWNDETAQQFRLAEESAADLARRYREAGYAVAFDHCRRPDNLDWLTDEMLGGPPVYRIWLNPSLETALARNAARLNKDFDPRILEATIRGLHREVGEMGELQGWIVLENEADGIESAVDGLLSELGLTFGMV